MNDTARKLITLDGLRRDTLDRLLESAKRYLARGAATAHRSTLAGGAVALLFCEPSTRTRFSFELAARRLGADVVALDEGRSSRTKGETLADTLAALAAMDVRMAVIRHREDGIMARVAAAMPAAMALVSAGEGTRNHPTQGLLDVLTIKRHRTDTASLSVAIIGDIAHSRVARSTARALDTLGVGELRLVGPPAFLPGDGEMPGRAISDLANGIRGADVVIALRIQRERMSGEEPVDTEAYRRDYGLDAQRLEKLAGPGTLLMHPGPVNWGVELDADLRAWPGNLIGEQIHNGVAMRMAVLEWLGEKT